MGFKPNENFIHYLTFVSERMNIFWKRQKGASAPFTQNEILSKNKFTNVYRSLDRVSQYLIKEVIYNGKQYSRESMFIRILLFKHFNSIETWELLMKKYGDIDENISFKDMGKFLGDAIDAGMKIYSNAYMVTGAIMKKGSSSYTKYNLESSVYKHEAYFRIFEKLLIEDGFMYEILDSKSMEELYGKLCKIPAFGDFISMQYCIDFNYSELFDFDENDFIVQGPGAERGIDRCFDFVGKPDYPAVIEWVTNNLDDLLIKYSEMYPGVGLNFIPLPNRKPTLIDIQNCFCETDKYMRGLGIKQDGINGKRIKNVFIQNNNKIDFKFPKKWGVEL